MKIDPGARYLFYLHGRIIEDEGERPTSPAFGVYEYRKILEQLSAAGFVVISEARASGTDVQEYAGRVLEQIRRLGGAGVPPGAISVVGFSKGSGIVQWVSDRLAEEEVSFVLLGSCGGPPDPRIHLTGRVLAVREESDEISGSCAKLFSQSRGVTASEEIVISTGKRHGAFYEPREEWLRPTLAWCQGTAP
ncbi:MAG: alpha/beta hydrolase [Acidobacteria bacterium]|nr:alpha/beta hydrolase [Acidobacteriota bacterium]